MDIFNNPYLYCIIKSHLNEYDIFSIECALNHDYDNLLYNFIYKRTIIPQPEIDDIIEPEFNNSNVGCIIGKCFYGSKYYNNPKRSFFIGGHKSLISCDKSDLTPITYDNIINRWFLSKDIISFGVHNITNIKHPSRAVNLIITGNNNKINVHSNVGIQNINIIGSNLTINFITKKLHDSLNIIDNNKIINL
jgi:hypothetical protein